MNQANVIFHVPFAHTLAPASAAGSDQYTVDPRGSAPEFRNAGIRAGAYFGRSTCVNYPTESNFKRREGSVALWFKPDWDWNFKDTLGRIIWDLRIDHGSVVPDDPSQRWALVYPNPAGKGTGSRPDSTFERWRFCVATNRNRYVIGTEDKRPDARTRQALFSSKQSFNAGDWLHLVATWTETEAAIFINGREDVRGPLPEGLPDKPLPESFQVGAVESWINSGPCGIVSDFMIFDRAVTEKDIEAVL